MGKSEEFQKYLADRCCLSQSTWVGSAGIHVEIPCIYVVQYYVDQWSTIE